MPTVAPLRAVRPRQTAGAQRCTMAWLSSQTQAPSGHWVSAPALLGRATQDKGCYFAYVEAWHHEWGPRYTNRCRTSRVGPPSGITSESAHAYNVGPHTHERTQGFRAACVGSATNIASPHPDRWPEAWVNAGTAMLEPQIHTERGDMYPCMYSQNYTIHFQTYFHIGRLVFWRLRPT